jgi:hypothetical protein
MKGVSIMNEQFGPMHHFGGYRPRPGRFLTFVVPLAIGIMIGKRSGMFRQGMGAQMGRNMGPGRRSWENGVPPFFAELHRRAHAAPEQPQETEA